MAKNIKSLENESEFYKEQHWEMKAKYEFWRIPGFILIMLIVGFLIYSFISTALNQNKITIEKETCINKSYWEFFEIRENYSQEVYYCDGNNIHFKTGSKEYFEKNKHICDDTHIENYPWSNVLAYGDERREKEVCTKEPVEYIPIDGDLFKDDSKFVEFLAKYNSMTEDIETNYANLYQKVLMPNKITKEFLENNCVCTIELGIYTFNEDGEQECYDKCKCIDYKCFDKYFITWN